MEVSEKNGDFDAEIVFQDGLPIKIRWLKRKPKEYQDIDLR